jgi:hypothetical protein
MATLEGMCADEISVRTTQSQGTQFAQVGNSFSKKRAEFRKS